MLNDVGALRLDPDIGAVAAAHRVPVILMHMKGIPKTMQVDPTYENLFDDIEAFLVSAVERAEACGIPRNGIIVDPGIGFGKTEEHNLALLGRLYRFDTLGLPILVGSSRKSFIQNILGRTLGRDMRGDSPEVKVGTQASVAAAVFNGAHIVRVHDVAQTRATVNILDAILNARVA